ncbi:MAG: class I SAM-dependent methyltransferase [Dehalococcoidia bacterium]
MTVAPGPSRNLLKHTSGNPLQRWLLDRFHATVSDLVAEILPQGGTILDVGCGEGFVANYLVARHPRLTVSGLDGSGDALRAAATSAAGGRLARCDAARLPVRDRSTDLAICLEVLEHLHAPDLTFRELRRVTRGPVIVSTPNQPFFAGANLARLKNLSTWGDDPEHVQWWTAAAFVQKVGGWLAIDQVVLRFPWTIVVGRRA